MGKSILDRLWKHKSEFHVVDPSRHLNNCRDARHYQYTASMLGIRKKLRGLDIGCYDGWLDFLLIEAGHGILGVEFRSELVDSAKTYARKKGYTEEQFDCLHGFIEHVNLAKMKFDFVIAYEVLEHIPLEDIGPLITTLETHMTPNGLMMISLPDQVHTLNPQHLWTPTESLIYEMWSEKPFFAMSRYEYPGTDIPANWMISWRMS